MKRKKIYFIFNPGAGKGAIKADLFGIIDTFTKSGYEVTVYPTQKCGEAVGKVKEAVMSKRYDLIVCSGGDGTLGEVVGGVMEADSSLPIGYIPAGTSNDFARSVGISKDTYYACETILTGLPLCCDIGQFTLFDNSVNLNGENNAVLSANSGGGNNAVLTGNSSGRNNAIGSNNVSSANSGGRNNAIGSNNALSGNSSGGNNAIGSNNALSGNSSGGNNAIGNSNALSGNSSGGNNAALAKYFTYIAAFGAFTEVAYETPQFSKNIFGRGAYVFEGARRIPSIQGFEMTIEHDAGTLKGEFAYGMITNSKSIGGGVLTQKDSGLDDGVFECTFIRMPSGAIELQKILMNLVNLNTDIHNANVTRFKSSGLKIKSRQEIQWTLDGEFGAITDRVEIYNRCKAINIMVPTRNGLIENNF
jgi:diacylglycerol kinase family enzyme